MKSEALCLERKPLFLNATTPTLCLFIKSFKNKQLSKKLDYIKIGLFKIINKVIEISYKLNLLLKIKIYLIYYIVILKLVYRNYKLLVYK